MSLFNLNAIIAINEELPGYLHRFRIAKPDLKVLKIVARFKLSITFNI
jgi:hypothetical protein